MGKTCFDPEKFWFTTTESSKSICNTTDSAQYTFNLNTTADFNETVAFSAVNLPAGITAVFNPTNLSAPGIFDVTLGNLSTLSPGNYSFIIRGQSTSDAFQVNVNLKVLASVLTPVILIQPLNNATAVANPVLFSWQTDSNSQLYDIQIASDSDFINIVESASITNGSYTSNALHNDRIYFWRVRNANLCGSGSFSTTNTFSTACIPPTNIALVNITKTSATIGWTDNASSWNVQVVPQGMLPSGVGTVTNSNPTVFNNLQPNTCYDFYLQAPCSTGTATWLASYTFCTTPDYCGDDHFYDSGGASGNYSNNEDKSTTIYPANAGDRVRVAFNEFDLGNCCDYMLVFNGPNDTYPFLIYLSGNDIPNSIKSTDVSGALTFVFHSNANTTNIGWDATVSCEPLPACPNVPSGFTLVNATTVSASIGWTENSNSTSWNVKVVPHNASPSVSPSVLTTSNPYVQNGLTPNTCYDFYIRSRCTSGTSDWAGPFMFCTQSDYCGGDHFYDTGGASGSYQNYEFKTTVIYPDAIGDRIRAVFNVFDIESCCDYFTIYNGTTVDAPILYNSEDNTGSPGTVVSTDSSGALTFQFSSDGHHTDDGWDAVITCESLPICASIPTNLNATDLTTASATLTWTENSGATSWEIQLVNQGVTPAASGTFVNSNTYSAIGLISNTCYDLYVRSACGGGAFSQWTTPLNFCTLPNYCAGDHFYDSGGLTGSYQNNESKITVITPDNTGDRIRAVFNDFHVDSGDRFRIYNGNSTASPVLYTSYNNPNPPTTLVSTDASGALTFKFTSNTETVNTGWDASISCELLPSCANQPSNISILNISAISANIGWQENSGSTLWEIEMVNHDTTPTGSGTIVNANSYQFSGLTPNTCYDVYIRSICNTSASAWTQPFICCTEPNYCGGQHFYDSGGASGNYAANENKTTTIYPGNPGERVRAIFNSYQFESCCDYLRIYNGPNIFYPLLYGDASMSPGSVSSTDISGALTFEFHSDANTNAAGWDATIICEVLPVCPNPPTNILASAISTTSATLTWTENANAIAWNIEMLPQGTTPSGIGTLVNNSSYIASLLNTNSCYDFYVQSICANGTTGWAGPYTFCTLPDYCGGDHFYDSGGPTGNYTFNENKTTVIFPTIAGDKVSATFNYFSLESCCDYLKIYNGPNATYPLLYNGGSNSPGTVQSNDTSGALTFEFHSDGNQNASGWDATIMCNNLASQQNDLFVVLEYYPNPTTRLLTINAHEKVKKYAVYDVSGKLLRDVKINQDKFEIDLQNYSAGNYFIELTNQSNKTKMIKVLRK
jgi:hypothetical protein